MQLSFTLVLSTVFLIFIFNSLWNLLNMFQSPTCGPKERCYRSYLNGKPALDLFVFLSDNSKGGIHSKVLHIEKFNYLEKLEKTIFFEIPESVRNNGSMNIHTILVPAQNRVKPDIRTLMQSSDSTYLKSRITKYALPAYDSFNLLKAESVPSIITKSKTHLRSKFVVVMCPYELNIPQKEVPVEIMKHMRINKSTNKFLPILQKNIMEMKIRDLVLINSEMSRGNITFIYSPVSYGKMRFIMQFDTTLYQFLHLGFNEKDVDDVKNIFGDTNLYLLCATFLIAGIHLLFDFLSFKNEVSFWKNQNSMAGLSTGSVIWRAVSQIIIFFYLSNEKTSLLVLIPSSIATVIEIWKVTKALKAIYSWERVFELKKKAIETEEEVKTRRYDEECLKYLSYILYPICMVSALYSLLYHAHTSWYSWLINNLVNGVYAFGFLFMLPQLFINYRLKSVAALPWRAFTYRAFNTFIDDIFAFIITMPTTHRLACFRDDIVFLIYLYQRWLYPVDKSRRTDSNGLEEIDEVVMRKEKMK